MTTLDINTPKGREAADQQLIAMEIVFGRSDEYCFNHTPTKDKNAAAVVDGSIVKNGIMVAFGEVKSRPFYTKDIPFTYEVLVRQCNCEWLISFHKIQGMQQLAKLMCLPSFGFLHLPAEEIVLGVKLVDEDGAVVCDHYVKTGVTQATCNGGLATRANAYVNMKDANIYRA